MQIVEPDGSERLWPMKRDYEALARVFMEPTADMPAELSEGLYLVHEMGTQRQAERIIEECQTSGLVLSVQHDDSPLDIALRLLLADPEMLKHLHNCSVMTRRRKFSYYLTDQVPVPRFECTRWHLRELERFFGEFYFAFRGSVGIQVAAYCRQLAWQDGPEWLFLAYHGERLQREEVLEHGEPASVQFRPRKYAVLKYNPLRGEIGVYCKTKQERRVLLRHFGRVFFGRPNFFPAEKEFDLSPLMQHGRRALFFQDIPGMEDARFTSVEFCPRGGPWRRTVEESDDLFRLFESGGIKWPERLEDVTRATFTVKLCRQKRARQMSIIPCNQAAYVRDEDSRILERWMEARGMAKPVES